MGNGLGKFYQLRAVDYLRSDNGGRLLVFEKRVQPPVVLGIIEGKVLRHKLLRGKITCEKQYVSRAVECRKLFERSRALYV